MTIDQAMQLGFGHHQAGRLAEAEQQYRLVLQHAPNHPDALYLLGMIARRIGKLDVAVELISRAIAINPKSSSYLANLGLVLLDQHKVDEAMAVLQKAIQLSPEFAEAHCNLGMAWAMRRQWDNAVDCFRTALKINPRLVEAYGNLANALSEQKQFQPAITALAAALQLNPQSDELNYNMGNVLRESGQLDQAISAYARAIEINPQRISAHCNLGNTLLEQGKHSEAMSRYRQAISIESSHAEAHWNLSLTQLIQGDFENGWAEHEWRLKCNTLARPREMNQPRWAGQPLAGQTILLHPEQGFGDMIQFARYAPLVTARGGKVILQCHVELLRLFANLPGVANVIAREQPLPEFDLHCPLMSLPFVFGTRLNSIPANFPYVEASQPVVDAWAAKMNLADTRRRIGLVWAGSTTHKNDQHRSIPLAQLSPLAGIKNARFFSLQKGPAVQQIGIAKLGAQLIDLATDLHDFAQTAGVIANLDLVITVDTSVAHLAGAMGKPVWVLLPYNPDWRWMLDRADSPWYPTMRLFRQPKMGDWPGVIAQVVNALHDSP